MRQRGEFEAAVFLRNDHAEEFVLLQVIPDLRRQIRQFVGGFPVVVQTAQFFAGSIQKSLLFGTEFRRRLRGQNVPVRATTEQLAFPADGAGFERHFLGLRQARRDALIELQERSADQRATQWLDIDDQGDRREQRTRNDHGQPVNAGNEGRRGDDDGRQQSPRQQTFAYMRGIYGNAQQGEYRYQVQHDELLDADRRIRVVFMRDVSGILQRNR